MSTLSAAVTLLSLFAQPAVPEPYRVGPGDVVEVAVDGRPDLSRMPTVQTTGSIWLPRAGDVQVRGLTPAEIAARLQPLLAGEDLQAPAVAVRVVAFNSQFVWVRKPLRSGTRLVDALLDAGGFVQSASGEVIVERASGFEGGAREARFRFTGKEPSPEELRRLELPLVSGDRVPAVVQRFVGVSGAVQRPGQYAYADALTVSALVEQAGPLRGGSPRVILRRAGVDQEVDLGDVRKGRAPEVPLEPGDQVLVKAGRL
jgi:protein involved in polysaccharide export with SLBB domain